jgi:hypothetical protein
MTSSGIIYVQLLFFLLLFYNLWPSFDSQFTHFMKTFVSSTRLFLASHNFSKYPLALVKFLTGPTRPPLIY